MFIFLLTLYFVANAAGRLMTRVMTQTTKLDAHSTALAVTLPTYLFGVIYGLLRQDGPLLEGVTPLLLLSALALGILRIESFRVSMVTQKHIETASFAILRMGNIPASVLVAALFLGEGLNVSQLAGMASILIGVTVVSTGGKMPHIKHFGNYELMALADSAFLGAWLVFNRYLITQTSLSTLMVLFAGIDLLPLIVTVWKRPTVLPSKKDIKLSAIIGFTTNLHIIAFWLAVAITDNVSLVSSISAFRVVAIFLASYLILKEKSHLKIKILGSTFALFGLMLT